ncbi:MAG: hydroxyethylthiazole kinase [Ignisphaera sp.]
MSIADLNWVGDAIDRLRNKKPLVHNITNFVVMNTTANALLALGASPIMSHGVEDLDDLVPAADAIVINIGTIDEEFAYSMLKAVQLAKIYKKPVVLDPVGAGATRFRTRVALTLLESGGISVVKGNFGEILGLLGEFGKTRGVDAASYDRNVASEAVLQASKKFNCVVGLTGYTDFVSNGSNVYEVRLKVGSQSLENVIHRVTGLGCIVSALIGAFLAVENPLKAAIAGLATFKAVSYKASEEAVYPGSFHVKLYDWLYRIDGDIIRNVVEVREIETG